MSYLTNFLGISTSIFLLGCSPALLVKNPGATDIWTNQSPTTKTSGQVLPVSARTWIAERPIELEVAKTVEQQDMGLMYRTSLPNDRGMLFEFKSARRVSFWMKNCQISLDMIFLRDGVVEAIELSAPPCTADPCPTYGPDTAVDRVIELRGGLTAELGVKVSDRIVLKSSFCRCSLKPLFYNRQSENPLLNVGIQFKNSGVAELRYDNGGQRMFWLPDLPL